MSTPPDFTPVPKVNDRGEEIKRPKARRVFDIPAPLPDNDEELLKKRFLCRGGGLLLVGQTGTGKSTLAMQWAMLWGAGFPCMGLVPARPLKSLIIQEENDDGDIAEMRDGVMVGLDLTGDAIQLAAANVLIHTESAATSVQFVTDVLEPLLEDCRPDLVWIDPALSYLGGDSSSQKDVGGFLRNGIYPLVQKYRCGCVIVHHTNKPAADNALLRGTDAAYLGAGSAEWANSARAVIALRATATNGLFELTLGKRGARVGWIDAAGVRSYIRHIKHAQNTITWVDAEPEDIPVKKAGRAPIFTVVDLVRSWEKDEPTGKWQKRCKDEFNMGRTTFYDLIVAAAELRAIAKEGNKWQADPEWRPNRSNFRMTAEARTSTDGGGSPEIQNSPNSVQTNPRPGSNKSAP